MRSSLTRDTFEEWNEILEKYGGGGDVGDNEEKLFIVLQELRHNSADLAFRSFSEDEAVAFLLMSVPRVFFYKLGKCKSKFLMSFAESWKPTLDQWVVTLYRYCGEAYNLFGMVLSENRKIPGYTDTKLCRSFLSTLTKFEHGEFAISGALGWIVQYPSKKILVRVHEQDLYELTRRMKPEQVGLIVRRWLIFKSQPKNCTCGWLPKDAFCKCSSVDMMDFDPLKEYCFPLFHTVCKRRIGGFDQFDLDNKRMPREDGEGPQVNNWNDKDASVFCATASENFLTETAYKELCKNMLLTEIHVEPLLKRPRKLNDKESGANWGDSFPQHSGCISRGCKVIPNFGCPNFACGIHCLRKGILPCTPHKSSGRKMPKECTECPIPMEKLMELARKGGHLGSMSA